LKKLCITIKDWPIAEAEFNRVGLEVEPFQAIVEDNRVLGFNKSVYACMKLAEGQDLLLFEDDVKFDGVINFSFPEDAFTVHLGCNLIGSDIMKWQMPTNSTPAGFARLHNCWQSHATWYSKQAVEFIIKNFKFVTDEYKTEGCQIFDEWLRVNVLPMRQSYVANPMVAYQRPRWSEIWNRESDYTGAHIQGNKWLKDNL
jgi:hypothetical protein